MTGILTYIMVIVMAFSSLGGVTANIEDTVSFDAKIGMDAETVLAMAGATGTEVTEETQQSMKVVGDVLNVLTLKGTATKDAVELALLANEDVILSLGVKNAEAGSTFASSLLGSNTIFFPAEMLEAMQQQATQGISAQASGFDASALDQLQNLDKEQIEKDVAELGEKLAQAIEAKKGETETGEFTADGLAFTARTPVNMTYDEFMELVLTGAKELAEKESLKPVIQATGKDIGAEIDKTLEDIKNQPEEDKPSLSLMAYTDADNCAYYTCEMAKTAKEEGAAGEQLYFAFGEVDGLNRVRFNGDIEKQKMDITSVSSKEGVLDMKATVEAETGTSDITVTQDEAGTLELVADIKSAETNAKLIVKAEPAEGERTAFSLEMYMGDAEKALLALTGSAGKGGELLSVFEGENVTSIPLEALSDENSTEFKKIMTTLMASLLKGITNLTKNLPEDSGTWLNKMVMQAMMPQTNTVPQGEPVVEGE